MVARRFGPEEERELIRLYESGWTQTRLADRFGTSPITVRKTLRRAGVEIRGPGGPRKVLTSGQEDEVKQRYRAGESQETIAKQLGTSQHKVSAVLRRAGIYSGRGDKFGQRHPMWKGGRVETTGGYIYLKVDRDDELATAMANGAFYVMEHRLIMARHLGRPLTEDETVHHINGRKEDNRLENLQLRNGKHGNGEALCCGDCGSHNIVPIELT